MLIQVISVYNCVSLHDQIPTISPVRETDPAQDLLNEGKTEGYEDYLESDLDLASGKQSGINLTSGSSCKAYFEQCSKISI